MEVDYSSSNLILRQVVKSFLAVILSLCLILLCFHYFLQFSFLFQDNKVALSKLLAKIVKTRYFSQDTVKACFSIITVGH